MLLSFPDDTPNFQGIYCKGNFCEDSVKIQPDKQVSTAILTVIAVSSQLIHRRFGEDSLNIYRTFANDSQKELPKMRQKYHLRQEL